MSYVAPMKDIQFVINELADLPTLSALPGCEDANPETVEAILEENAKFCSEVVAPLNVIGDREPSSWKDGKVTTTKGFKEAFKAFTEAGWQGVQHPAEFGGQGLPKLVAAACFEMNTSANLSFSLCSMLTDGAIEALLTAGSDEQKNIYLENLIAGKWTGTMNLTEPQAGSDLAQVRTRAVPQGDGTYKVFGTKIFITYGEHDMAENIVHLVLGRTPDAPEGVKGISLFVVPKFLVNKDGSLGERNDVHCVSIEHKLGIHASPTAVLAYGDHGGAVGYLVGEENRGLEYMFIMMNLARFSVGIEGIGIAERAYQRARAYARDRVQGRAPGLDRATPTATILQHPDVRRMLLTMKAQTEAMRAVAYVTGAAIDNARRHPDAEARKQHQAFVDLMIPIVKGWSTELAQEVTYLGVQVHGGMGFIEETGAAQDYRDARITTIYEGTTAIQANDLVGRKTARDGGAVARAVCADIAKVASELSASDDADLKRIGAELTAANTALRLAVDWVVPAFSGATRAAHAASVPYLRLWGLVAGGWQLARGARAASARLAEGGGDADFYRGKIATARFYADCLLPQAAAWSQAITQGSEAVLALADAQF
jgi:butyryl-CoA dehydrogenase